MSDSDKVIREELRARVHRILDKQGKQVSSYGRPGKPHLMMDIEGIELHRDDFGMYVYVSGHPIYTEVRDEQCTNFNAKKAAEALVKLRNACVLDDLADQG